MAICPSINLSKPAKFKREHRVYLALSTLKCTHWRRNWHVWSNPAVRAYRNTPDGGSWPSVQIARGSCEDEQVCSQLVFSKFMGWRLVMGLSKDGFCSGDMNSKLPLLRHPPVEVCSKVKGMFSNFYLYLPVRFLLLLNTRKKANMPRGSPF